MRYICTSLLNLVWHYNRTFLSLPFNTFGRLNTFVMSVSGSPNSKRHKSGNEVNPLKSFLEETRRKSLENFKKCKKVHVVLGNEACDLDSTVSAISLAYFNSQTNQHASDDVDVPVLNIPRADFPLRGDVKHLLSKNGVAVDLLTFRDDVDLRRLHDDGRLRLSLVDFHVLSRKDEPLYDNVVQVIDHRKQEKTFNDRISTRIELVGSCSTLVAAELLGKNFEIPPSLVNLLYSAIIVDTICMSETAGKKTRTDEDVVKRLEELKPELVDERQLLFEEIHKARSDVSGLSTLELLRKDMKIVAGDQAPGISVAMSTVEENIQTFFRRSRVNEDLGMFEKERKVTAVILMFVSIDQDKQLSRQLVVCCVPTRLRQEICRILTDSNDPSLALSRLTLADLESTDLCCYTQGNVQASRKAILPIIKDSLTKLAKFL